MEVIYSGPSTSVNFERADIDYLQAETRHSPFAKLPRTSCRSYLGTPRSASVSQVLLNRLQSLGIGRPKDKTNSVVTVTSSRRDLLQGRCAPALIIHREDGRLHLTFTSGEKAAQKLRDRGFPPDFTFFALRNYLPPKIFRDSPRPFDSPRIPAPLIFYSEHKIPTDIKVSSDTMGRFAENYLALSPLDQIAPRIYVRTIFAFNAQDDYDSSAARDHLLECFHEALIRWPFLAGQIRPAAQDKNRLELAYTLEPRALNPARRSDIFDCQRIQRLGGYTYQELVARGMPPSAMDKDKLSHSPNHPRPGECCPPVTLKMTEMEGGLFLCFSTHHGIMDGGFIKTFLEYFASIITAMSSGQILSQINGAGPSEQLSRCPRWLIELKERPSMDIYEDSNIKDFQFLEYDFTRSTKDSLSTTPKPPQAVCKMFKFDNLVVQSMKAQADAYVKEKYSSKAFVTTTDTLSAMVWVHVTRARYTHLSSSDKSNFTLTVDARPYLSPPFAPTAWGNIYTQTVASPTVDDLIKLENTGAFPDDSLPAIFEAAWLIRGAVNNAREPTYIPSRIALAASLEDPAMEGTAFRKANRPDHAGLGCSVWYHMGADIDFKIPGTGGKADFVRKTWSANDGSMNIMQRRGMTKGDAPWDVLLALREDDMERVCGNRELGRWASSWIQ